MKFLLPIIVALLFSGCVFTKYETIEIPVYIDRPLPSLKVYPVESAYEFINLRKENGYILIPVEQFQAYISIKKNLEEGLNSCNQQALLFNQLNKKD